MRTHTKMVMFVVIGVCIGAGVWFGFMSSSRASQSNPVRLSKLPPIKSCVEHVKLVKAELVDQGDFQVATLELENQAYVGVIAVSIETVVGKVKHSVVESGFSPDKPPLIVIPPHERKTLTIGNLGANSPIRIASVAFSDGTEEGCESSLKTMRELKNQKTKREGPQK
jgi:hypothetical protein